MSGFSWTCLGMTSHRKGVQSTFQSWKLLSGGKRAGHSLVSFCWLHSGSFPQKKRKGDQCQQASSEPLQKMLVLPSLPVLSS